MTPQEIAFWTMITQRAIDAALALTESVLVLSEGEGEMTPEARAERLAAIRENVEGIRSDRIALDERLDALLAQEDATS